MYDIKLVKIDETKFEVWTSEEISRELVLHFSARPSGYKFMPSYKNGMWDGWIRFYSNNKIPIGLLEEMRRFAEDKNYSLFVDFDDELGLDKKDFKKFLGCLNLPEEYELRDYQIDAAYDCINKTKMCVKANTGAGKSLLMYYVVRFLALEDKKILLVVPSTSLVEQMYKDWKGYGWKSIDDYVQKIYSGMYKNYDKQVIIITWQSMIKDIKVLKKIDVLMIDESHLSKSKSIQTIGKNCKNAKWRLGFSGTYPEYKTVDWFSIVGTLGDIKQYTTFESLRKDGNVSDLKIENLFFDWPLSFRRRNYIENRKNYQGENSFIESIPKRISFISKLANNLKGNTIILFTRIDYGKRILEYIEENFEKKCYFITGDIKTDRRELIRSRMEDKNGIILLASYGVFSQGINIRNIHNIIMSSNYKSMIKVVQSIGRGIRVSENKDQCNIYNLIDDLCYDDNTIEEKYVNYSVRHHKERLKIYDKEGFDNIRNVRIGFDKK